MLRELTAIIRSNKWKATAEALRNAGFPALTRQRVYGRGRQKGLRYGTEPGAGGIPVLPKWMLTLVVEDEQVDAALSTTFASFAERHRDLRATFADHFETIAHRIPRAA